MTSTGGGGRIRGKWDNTGLRGLVGDSKYSGRPIFFFIKENCICGMTRDHAELKINILLTRNLPFGSDVRPWRHLLMILHCLSTKSENRTRGQFECDVTWFCFCLILFVLMHSMVVVPSFVGEGEGFV